MNFPQNKNTSNCDEAIAIYVNYGKFLCLERKLYFLQMCELFQILTSLKSLPRPIWAIVANYDERVEIYACNEWLEENNGKTIPLFYFEPVWSCFIMEITNGKVRAGFDEKYLEKFQILANREESWIQFLYWQLSTFQDIRKLVTNEENLTMYLTECNQWPEPLFSKIKNLFAKEIKDLESQFISAMRDEWKPWFPK